MQPEDVDIEQGCRLLRRERFGHARRRDTGVVNQNVDAACLGDDFGHSSIDRSGVGNIQLDDFDVLATECIRVIAVFGVGVAHRGKNFVARMR